MKDLNKKILIVTEYFYPEEFKINEIAIEWKNKGYEVAVLTKNPTYPFGKIYSGYKNKCFSVSDWNGIKIYRLKAVTGYKNSILKKILNYFSFMFLGSIVSLRIGKKYDYVFGNSMAALTGMIPAIVLNKFYNKKVTLWVQDIWTDSVYAYGFKERKIIVFLLDRLVKFVYKHTTNFAVSAKGFEKKIRPYLDRQKKIIYAPNWADFLNKELSPFKLNEEKKIHFVFAGNIGAMQNLENIIKAFGTLDNKYLNSAQLNIIGDGSCLEHLKFSVNKNKYKNIVFWGKVVRNDIYKYLNASDFLIVSLINKEIFSLTVPAKTQTYIAAEKPIVAIINGEVADIIKENELGFVAPPDNINEIHNVLISCLSLNAEEKQKFTKNCKQLTNTVFNKTKIVDNLLALLLEK